MLYLVQEPIQASIHNFLQNFAYEDALFLAEILHAEVNSEKTLVLLAKCCVHCKQEDRAASLLNKPVCLPESKLLKAQIAFQLGRYDAAKSYLSLSSDSLDPDALRLFYRDLSCFVFQLLGKIYNKIKEYTLSQNNFEHSLKSNMYLWSSFVSLCDEKQMSVSRETKLGDSKEHTNVTPGISVDSIYGPNVQQTVPNVGFPAENVFYSTDDSDSVLICAKKKCKGNLSEVVEKEMKETLILKDVFPSWSATSSVPPLFGILPLSVGDKEKQLERTPSKSEDSLDFPPRKPGIKRKPNQPEKQKPETKPRDTKPPASRRQILAPNTCNRETNSMSLSASNRSAASVRRSDRLVKENRPTKMRTTSGGKLMHQKENSASATTHHHRLGSFNKASSIEDCVKEEDEDDTSSVTSEATCVRLTGDRRTSGLSVNSGHSFDITASHAIADVISHQKKAFQRLLNIIATAYAELSTFQCETTAAYLENELSPDQLNTPHIQSLIGKIHFENQNYESCIEAFKKMRQLDWYYLNGLSIYSTALWQKQDSPTLLSLAHGLKCCLSQPNPVTFIVMADWFLVIQDMPQAIKSLECAVQLEPDNALAFLNLGSAYFNNNQINNAAACYRRAIRLRRNDYVAWFRSGKLYFQLEQYEEAVSHFRCAFSLHPKHPVIITMLARCYYQIGDTKTALRCLKAASVAKPDAAHIRYYLAKILHFLNRHQEALIQVEILKQLAPREAQTYILAAEIFTKLGDTQKAQLNFSWATTLNGHVSGSANAGGVGTSVAYRGDAGHLKQQKPMLTTPNDSRPILGSGEGSLHPSNEISWADIDLSDLIYEGTDLNTQLSRLNGQQPVPSSTTTLPPNRLDNTDQSF